MLIIFCERRTPLLFHIVIFFVDFATIPILIFFSTLLLPHATFLKKNSSENNNSRYKNKINVALFVHNNKGESQIQTCHRL
jgi:hypothetical protein